MRFFPTRLPIVSIFPVLIACGLAAAGTADRVLAADYVGADACTECHREQTAAWRGSHHDLAMQRATPETVLGDFDDAEFTYDGTTSRFYRRGGAFYVRTDGADGGLEEFEVAYTFGVSPLQQYLVEFGGGRLQALPLAWDTRARDQGGQKWFHLYPGQRIGPGDPLHWTGRNQNWNFMCAECHSTNLRRNYDVDGDSYDTTWAEINVACEACHGPASSHVEWAENGGPEGGQRGFDVDLRRTAQWSMDRETGIARNLGPSPTTQIENCARCHSRRINLFESYRPGRRFEDFYRPQVLLQNLYFADGQIRDEVYVYGSFLQSAMYRGGVVCSDCHDPHSLQLKAEGNALCGQCHMADRFDTPKHHFHPEGSEAARCVSCHMPVRTYMVNDDRRDHSFRVPRPDLAEQTDSPDACTGCHQGRSPQWAADAIAEQVGGPVASHYGVAIQAGRAGALDAEQRLIALAQDASSPNIARATAAVLLGAYLSPISLQTVAGLLLDSDALVRVNALSALEGLDPQLRLRLAADLLSDPVRMVRIEAAGLLADVPGEAFTAAQREAFGGAVDDYITAQKNNAERSESWVNLGNLYLRLGSVEKASAQYRYAIELDPGYAPAYVNLADLYRSQNNDEEAERVLLQGIERVPDAAGLHHAYGLLLVRRKEIGRAVGELERAVQLDPGNTRLRYVYAIGLDAVGDDNGAIAQLEAANQGRPADRDVLTALIDFHRRKGGLEDARRYAQDLVAVAPWDRNARALLEQLSN